MTTDYEYDLDMSTYVYRATCTCPDLQGELQEAPVSQSINKTLYSASWIEALKNVKYDTNAKAAL